MLDCEYLVIGAGQTGLTVAAGLAQKDKKIILVDQNKIGGGYLFTNEIPQWLLRKYANDFATSLEIFKDQPTTFQILLNHRKKIGKNITKGIHHKYKEWEKFFAKHKNVQIVAGTAEFLSKSLVEVNSPTERHLINFANCVIATGKDQLVKPHIQGLEDIDFLYKDNCFLFEHIPTQIAFLGLTEETLEVASTYADLGIKVDIVDSRANLTEAFARIDKSIINFTIKRLLDKQADLHFGFDIKEVKNNKKGEVVLKNTDGQTKTFAEVYIPLAESFSGKSLMISKIGVKSNKHGITTDAFGKTSQGHIYALGEASNKTNRNSKHFMIQEYLQPQSRAVDLAKLIAQKSLGLDTDYFYVRASEPVFGIGMSEDEAVDIHGNAAKSVVIKSERNEAFAKIVYRDINGKLLGGALAGEVCEQGKMYLLDAFQKSKPYKEVVQQLKVFLRMA